MHGGHVSKVNDFDWNMREGYEMQIASAEDESCIHVFDISNNIYNNNKQE